MPIVFLVACGSPRDVGLAAPAVVAPSASPPAGTVPHGDHNPRFGGLVLMDGDLHFEVILGLNGQYGVYFSDAVRTELPAAVASEVSITVMRSGGKPETVRLEIDDSGEAWVGRGKPVDDPAAMARVSFTTRGMPYFIDIPFQRPAPLAPGKKITAMSIDEAAREYVRLVFDLGERDPDSIDFYAGPGEWVADIRRDPPKLESLRSTALALAARLADVHDSRATHMIRELRALAARVDVITGRRASFDAESRALFGLAPPPEDVTGTNRIRSEISRALGGAGPLADRYERFERRFAVPPARLPAVLTRALSGCRERTRAHLELPDNEQATLEYVRDKPWSGFSRYQGNSRSRIFVNTDFGFTVDRALQFACHEGYPGHHARNTLLDSRLVRQQGWQEFSVQSMFGPAALVSEATAMTAVDVAFPGDDRAIFERDELFPLAGLGSADVARYVKVERLVDSLQMAQASVLRDYLDEALDFPRAAERLTAVALVGNSPATLKFTNEYRTYVTTYTAGPALVMRELAACGDEAASRWRCFGDLLTDPTALLFRGD
jgi:hypothetical protein